MKAQWLKVEYGDYGIHYACGNCGAVSPTGTRLPVCPYCKSLMKWQPKKVRWCMDWQGDKK